MQSLNRNAPPAPTYVIWTATTNAFLMGYSRLRLLDPIQRVGMLDRDLRRFLALRQDSPTVTFFCDDDILYRPLPDKPADLLLSDDRILSVCLYLGRGNVKQPIPDGFPLWDWRTLPRHDFGFPTALDGNTYRVADFLRLIDDDEIANPTILETVISLRAESLAEERPLIACYEDQCLVGVPVNRVSENSGVAYGRTYPHSTVEMNERFLAGERIDLDALDFSDVDSCHHEIEFVWRKA